MTCYSCDCNRFDDVDPYECPNGVAAFLHNLNGEDARKKYREIKDKCIYRIGPIENKYGDKIHQCVKEDAKEECAHWCCPIANKRRD